MNGRYETFWARCAAGIIDGMIFLPVSAVIGYVYKEGLPIVVYIALVFDSFLFFLYSVYFHGKFGQTLGKYFMKVRVLSVDETPLSMRQAFMRDSLPISLFAVYLMFAIAPVFSGAAPNTQAFKQQIPLVIYFVGPVILALEIGTMLTNSKRRSLHDLIAGSVVVRRVDSSIGS
jgi:uncharacterized RDD family membrane protein YckC